MFEENGNTPKTNDQSLLPTKSSMEILSELFSTFDAEPPLIIKKEQSEDSLKKHKKNKKKHKHKEKKHKKKDKKKKRSDSSSSESAVDLATILVKQEKDATEKNNKTEGNISLEIKLEDIKQESTKNNNKNSESVKEPKYLKEEHLDTYNNNKDKEKKHKKKKVKSERKRSRSKSREKTSKKVKVEKASKIKTDNKRNGYSRDRDRSYDKSCKSKRDYHKDETYKSGHSNHRKERHRSKEHERKDKNRDRSREKHLDDFSKDLEDYKKKRYSSNVDDGFYKPREHDRNEDRDRGRDDERSIRERYRSRSYDRDRRYRSDSRERSSKFDKKKLLEIARKNAITMMKSGNLPGALSLGPQAQEKVIAAIKSGGKTIEELTDFCKTLSTKEELGELSSLSEKEDSDSDTDKAFHHPFQIKDRPTTITMNIKNSVPLPVKSTVERTSELRIQFPVSSGQHHRKGEDWLPVSSPPKSEDKEKAIAIIPPPTVRAELIPLPALPVPEVLEPVVPVPPVAPELPTVPAPVNAPPGPQVFPSPILEPSVDLGSIVSQRLTALRRLQENPNDVQALSQMYKSNKEMQTWASSKQQLGQFTGSTGVQILSQAELSSGYQAWAKKDQLQTAAPVSGGMGMHLLQKMGWKPGEGLGKEKTGTLEPLLLEVKLDKKGLVANEEQKGKNRKQVKNTAPAVKNLHGKHPVSLLGEYSSKKKLGAPQYILEFECGPDHKKNFLYKVLLNGVEYKPNIVSNNKKEAKAAAATVCLQQIGLLPS